MRFEPWLDGVPSGLTVIVSRELPLAPSPGEVARRIVRHGMAEILAWLGEDVGPRPDDVTHALRAGHNLLVSGQYAALLLGGVVDVAARHTRLPGGDGA
ncbi:hypothetical protein ACK8HX_02215 [Oryzobacter sp. R7]|uniref:hypothetical protein n=1 Tax=Oryzobacter faecalis TaxID=3388656 RepID=UPI00398CFAD6